MARKKYQSIRFAVGSENGIRSSIWHLWTPDPSRATNPKSDFYLEPSPLGGIMKISFHEEVNGDKHKSGEWQISFTREFAEKMKHMGGLSNVSRHRKRWKKPPEIFPGGNLAFRIYIPHSELRKYPGKITKLIDWVEVQPVVGYATEFLIVLTKPDTRVTNWPGKNTGTKLLVKFGLCNGDNLWVLHRIEKMALKTINMIEKSRTEDRNKYKDHINSEYFRSLRYSEEPDGSRTIYEIAL